MSIYDIFDRVNYSNGFIIVLIHKFICIIMTILYIWVIHTNIKVTITTLNRGYDS